MTPISENIFFGASILGLLISAALISNIFTERKSNFFIGIVVLILSFELLFSWGARSGYNSTEGAFPIWILLNYLVIPPCIWLFVKYNIDDNFQFRLWHGMLFLPALIKSGILIWAFNTSFSLMKYPAWVWFSDYLPLLGLVFSLGYFWISYSKIYFRKGIKPGKRVWITQVWLLLLMVCLSLISILWFVFSIIGWTHFNILEQVLIFLVLGLAFINFLNSQTFPTVAKADKNKEFEHYDDQSSLKALNAILEEKELFLRPNLPLKELAAELRLPYRYLSYLINQYHHKNYKEFINQFRIDAFLNKARSQENDHKTLLALALESGFSSKSTFNQVFKKHLGKSPSEYLKKVA